MSWFTKKQSVPDLPSASRLPDLPDIAPEKFQPEQKLPELPSFPENFNNDKLNNEIVKSAVSDSSVDLGEVLKYPGSENLPDFREREVKIEELPKDFRLQTETEQKPEQYEIPQRIPEKRTLELSQSMMSQEKTKSYEPIFVKIDKFNSAQSDFLEIKKKMNEFESILRKVKDLKAKEDAEIAAWTEDFEKIKSRLSDIDNNIFSKL